MSPQDARAAMQEQWADMIHDYGKGMWIDVMEPLVEDMVETWLNRRLAYTEGLVEYYSSSDDNAILLNRTPVTAVTEVKVDPSGGYGQLTNTFGSDTILTPGEHYFLDLDGEGDYQGMSCNGILYRNGGNWGYRRTWQQGLLAAARTQTRGNIKVTYNGGYTRANLPGGIRQSIFLILARIWQFTPQPVMVNFESWGGYSYSHTLSFSMKDPIFTDIRLNLSVFKRYRPGVSTS